MAKEKGDTKFANIPVGTLKYMALSAHDGVIEEDADMKSLGYSLFRLYGLGLPWVNDKSVKIKKPELTEVMRKIKEKTVLENWVSTNVFSFSIGINFGII